MDEWRRDLTDWLAGSELRELVLDLLSNVPGLPPIVQSVHLVGVAVIMASLVIFSLRTLGLAATGQRWAEMQGRMIPWLWWVLPVMVVTGGMFVVARPGRYVYNPVFAIKVALLLAALTASVVLARMKANGRAAKVVAIICLLSWAAIVLAGRWIAYADYLFPYE